MKFQIKFLNPTHKVSVPLVSIKKEFGLEWVDSIRSEDGNESLPLDIFVSELSFVRNELEIILTEEEARELSEENEIFLNQSILTITIEDATPGILNSYFDIKYELIKDSEDTIVLVSPIAVLNKEALISDWANRGAPKKWDYIKKIKTNINQKD
ncbi:MAG: hypothetical protein OEL54_02575 [Flavobacteriaceae bacterium]|nr:hypothetical protein [Flavobacteriaceae bacterium]